MPRRRPDRKSFAEEVASLPKQEREFAISQAGHRLLEANATEAELDAFLRLVDHIEEMAARSGKPN